MGKVGDSTVGGGGDEEYADDSFGDDNSMEEIEIDEQLEIADLSDEEYF